MPRLKDLLEYLAAPGREDVWLLLDIKVRERRPRQSPAPFDDDGRLTMWRKLDNDAEEVMRLIAQTVNAVKPSRAWEERVLLGCWAVCVPDPRSSTAGLILWYI